MEKEKLAEQLCDIMKKLSERPDLVQNLIYGLDEPPVEDCFDAIPSNVFEIPPIDEEPNEGITAKEVCFKPTYKTIEGFCGLDPDGCVLLDTETTGVGGGSRIVELSVIDLKGNVLYNQLFDPCIPMPIQASEVNGITDDMLVGKPRFEDEIDKIAAILEEKTLIGWNIPFDEKMLGFEFSYAGRDRVWRGMWDAMTAFARANDIRSKNGRFTCKLVRAKEILGLGDSQEHRALGDCFDTLAVMDLFLDGEEEFRLE